MFTLGQLILIEVFGPGVEESEPTMIQQRLFVYVMSERASACVQATISSLIPGHHAVVVRFIW